MLLNLHVKNLALIDEADVNLGEGLNVLTGETGAGKSILIDAVNMALGAKTARGLLRENGEPAGVELLFQVSGEEKEEALRALGVAVEEDGSVLIVRRMSQGRSVCRINDETVTVSKLRAVTALLIDIHGQHEHQSLLHKAKHLEILDAYARPKERDVKERLGESYRILRAAEKELASYEMGEEERIREMDFLSYEIGEPFPGHGICGRRGGGRRFPEPCGQGALGGGPLRRGAFGTALPGRGGGGAGE